MKQAWDDNMMDEDSDDDDEDPVFGITSIVNMTNYLKVPFIDGIENYLLDKLEESPATYKTDEKLLFDMFHNPSQANQKSVGLLINERYINIPPAVSVPLLEGLSKEIKRAVEKKKMDFKFHYFVMILKFHRRAVKDGGQPAEDIYSNPDEELLAKNSQFHFEYSVAKECDSGLDGKWKEGDEQLEPFRQVIVLDVRRFDGIVEGIKQFLVDGVVRDNILAPNE